MAIALVDHAGAANPDTFTAVSPAINSTGANFLVLGLGFYSNNDPNVSDSKSNGYTPLFRWHGSNAGDYNARVYYRGTPTVGAGHTATADSVGTKEYPVIELAAFSGIDYWDVQNGNYDDGTVTSLQPGAVAPGQNGSLLFTVVFLRGFTSGQTFAIDNGFTILDEFAGDGSTHTPTAFAWKLQGTAASINPTWSWDNGGDSAVSTIAAFAPLAGGGGGNPWYYYQNQALSRGHHRRQSSRWERRRSGLIVPRDDRFSLHRKAA